MTELVSYYDNLYKNDDSQEWERAPGKSVIVNAVRNHLDTKQIPQDCKILDVGCGTGFLLARLQNEINRNQFDLYGVDYSMEAIRKGESNRKNMKLSCQDGSNMDYKDESFDVVISYGSYEHFNKPSDAIKELSRILKPSGNFFCMMPALGVDRVDRNDEGWYEEREIPGSNFRQMQWNLYRDTWEQYFESNELKLYEYDYASEFGAIKPGVFFFGVKA